MQIIVNFIFKIKGNVLKIFYDKLIQSYDHIYRGPLVLWPVSATRFLFLRILFFRFCEFFCEMFFSRNSLKIKNIFHLYPLLLSCSNVVQS